MTPEDAQSALQHALDVAEANMRRDGRLIPIFIFMTKDTALLMPAPFHNDEEKLRALKIAQLVAIQQEAEVVTFVNEVWRAPPDLPEGVAPSESERRTEAVMVVMAWTGPDGIQKRGLIAAIERDDTGAFSGLGKREDMPIVKGRMTDLLPTKPPGPLDRAAATALLEVVYGVELRPIEPRA